MADNKPALPESAANARLDDLQTKVAVIRKELRTLQGRISNRDPAKVESLKDENQELSKRIKLMEKALFGLIDESLRPRQGEDLRTQYEVRRQAAVEYCKKANLDPEIWKSIVS